MFLPLLLSASLSLNPAPQGHGHGNPHGNGHFVPPGLAKKGGLPPGLAKKFGRNVPEHPYVAIDPRYRDRAWFLIDGQWQLRRGFTASIQAEVGDALRLTMAPP